MTTTPDRGDCDGTVNSTESFRFFATGNHRRIPDTPASEAKYRNGTARHEEIVAMLGEDESWKGSEVTLIKYIDDYNAVESLNTRQAVTTYSSGRQIRKLHAWKSEEVFNRVVD